MISWKYSNSKVYGIYLVAVEKWLEDYTVPYLYSISQEICTRFVVLCFVVVMQSFIMNSHEVFIHIHQGCFAGTGAIVRLPQCQWSKPDGYGKIGQCITTTKHSKAKTVCIFLGIYCISHAPLGNTRLTMSYTSCWQVLTSLCVLSDKATWTGLELAYCNV